MNNGQPKTAPHLPQLPRDPDRPRLAAALRRVLARRGEPPLYLAGGAVRNRLRPVGAGVSDHGVAPERDLDFTLPTAALAFAEALARELGGTLVVLDPEHDVARVVWRDRELDFAAYREGAASIEEDLARRDFTINAMAWRLNPPGAPGSPGSPGSIDFLEDLPALPRAGAARPAEPGRLIDPCNGRQDLAAGIIRVTHAGAFAADPLRLLRAYRFQATLAFTLEPVTEALIRRELTGLAGVAVERIRAELDEILAAPAGARALTAMAASGLLYRVLPELAAGAGLEQPDSHHLDVTQHSIEALAQLDRVLAAPARFFPDSHQELTDYLAEPRAPNRRITLRWAALLHDLGKPPTCRRRGARLTFYNHDQAGAELCGRLARRLRFSRERGALLQRLVAHHMWPFHLNNARRRSSIKPRACLRLVRALGDDLPALFFLAMADSLAGQGPGKPPRMEQELATLHAEVTRVAREQLAPVLRQPPLLNGHDLRQTLGLAPGPLFKEILAGLEQARVEGRVNNREEALAWVRNFITARPPCRNRSPGST